MIRIATRRSPLARRQAEGVADLLRAREKGLEVKLCELVTKGDKILDQALARVGGKGLFVKEIEDALLEGQVEIAVHSMKDLPVALARGLTVGAVPVREDARDALCSPRYLELSALPRGASVGTSSIRRASQLRALRPDLRIQSVRGNVGTRLAKLSEGLDAVVLAYAGLRRLDLSHHATQLFDPSEMLPAVGQGALALEARSSDAETLSRLLPLEDASARRCVEAERALLQRLGGGCQLPLAAHATVEEGRISLRALVASLDGKRILRGAQSASSEDARALGEALGEELLGKGAAEILRDLTGDVPHPGNATDHA
ncbi:MAG TPA: hydroxymethylbilane synthase [Anaeromyxobacteraceae bacterium]|nr:hydroxymethylbilane synthase [Anaeromyxobacteraceae bacterium]